MKYQPIITVGRQYGSGGRYVAKLLAEKLEIPFYDKELLAEASRDSGICQELRDHENVINVFVKASTEERIKRVIKYNGADPVKAEEIIRKADKQRASYYNYYATGTWGDVSNYDLCVDTGTLGIGGCVDLICRCVEIKRKQAEEEEKEW